MIGVMGHIQTRNYENNQGQRVYVTEVVVENFALLESRAVTEARPQEPNQGGNQPNGYGQNNFGGAQQPNPNGFGGKPTSSQPSSNNGGNTQPTFGANNGPDKNAADPFANSGQPIDISDDDLPF